MPERLRPKRRAHLVKRVDSQGAVSKIRPFGDEQPYRDFFARIDKSVFTEKERL